MTKRPPRALSAKNVSFIPSGIQQIRPNFPNFEQQASTTAVSRGGARLVAFLPMVVFCCRDRRDHHSGAVSRDRNLVEHFEVHELTPDALFCDGELFHALISRKRVNWIFYDIP